ncbi:MAG: aliphatic sulfonate ABC transporter substrate-binding protein [Rhizobiales bacterium]|nr:aliphatic sulfonate ABC transporter substrate-binding protein [Hyphomicrobiales bacterium]
MFSFSRRSVLSFAAATAIAGTPPAQAQTKPTEIRIDFATYNPVGLLLKDRGLLEKEFARDGIAIRWVQSLGSNKALEFLNAGSIDFGSTAGAAALIGRINGNPIKSVYVYSKPEWTALVTKSDAIKTIADLKGKRVAVTRGTDPHIFLVRALQDAKLTEKDVKLVLLQHPDGKLALERGDVDAWAGLDPIMAAAEAEFGAKLFFRRANWNTWGVLNVSEEFAKKYPDLVTRVLKVYEDARKQSVAEPAALKASLIAATKLPDAVIDRQIARTDITSGAIGAEQAKTILEAGLALQSAGVIPCDADVKSAVDALIGPRFVATKAAAQ